MTSNALLDTHAFIWLMEGNETISKDAKSEISKSAKDGTLFLSAISIWEIAMLQNKGKISLTLPLHKWVEDASSLPFLKIVNVDSSIAIESCKLPGNFHGDPADRMIVATSRLLSVPLITRDKKIIDYAKDSYLNIVEC